MPRRGPTRVVHHIVSKALLHRPEKWSDELLSQVRAATSEDPRYEEELKALITE